jgi:hypothetical protein
VVYLDDIFIFSNTREEHIQHIQWVLEQLRTHQLYAKMKKCEWGKTEVNYLGHIINQGQVAPEPQKIRAVKEWPISTTVKEVQAFLGLANYYRRFVYRFSHIAHPLTELTKKEKSWLWTEATQAAFNQLKQALIIAPVLRIFNPNLPTRTEHDASDYAWAGVLLQKHVIIAGIQ